MRFPTIRLWFEHAEEYGQTLRKNQKKTETSGVTLSTMHMAKGLEWKHVFVIDVNKGIVPLESESGTGTDLEEERRLFYVALTRAKDNLYVYSSSKAESMFIKELN